MLLLMGEDLPLFPLCQVPYSHQNMLH